VTTVLADWHRAIIVADSQTVIGDMRAGFRNKLRRIPDPKGGDMLLGTAGRTSDALLFEGWLRGGMDIPYGRRKDLPELSAQDFGALLVRPDGLYMFNEDYVALPIEEGWFAIGNGAPYAMAAYLAGADPVEAVRIACKLDVYTGGPICYTTLAGDEGRKDAT
jgi:ATP-dependent protease HslVU (ClpYQ) peptidase subunit